MRPTIEDMHSIAEEKGGKCLSKEYVNGQLKLFWECSKGHQWFTAPDNIRRGNWCPKCAGIEKLTIKEMHSLAKKKNGKCLSKEYINNNTKLLWECSEGHQWEAVPNSIKLGTWCPKCAGKLKHTIEDMHSLAEKKGGKCLSKEYVNIHSKLLWECSKGHQWEAVSNSIKHGTWCPECAGRPKLTIDDMHILAKGKNGKCLSEKYVNSKTKLQWECSEGHQWWAISNNIQHKGRWCPKCGGSEKLTIDDMHILAKGKNGKCLSEKYVNSKTKLLWECSEGHQWKAMPSKIKWGRWCPECAGNKKYTMNDIYNLAEKKGGKCLSKEYLGAHKDLLWKCSEGHQWYARPNSIRRGSWCPECSEGLSERICRAHFEQLIGQPFPKSYPIWLQTQESTQLELDGFCEPLGIAFEHQGDQHYRKNDYFHTDDSQFQRQQELDSLKRHLCKENGVTLVEIPQLFNHVSLTGLKAYIVKCLTEEGEGIETVEIRRDWETFEVDLKDAHRGNSSLHFEIIQNICIEKGGRCLSDNYLGNSTHLKFECEKEHRWEATPGKIKMGRWCPECAGNVKLTIDDMHSLAEKKNGKCLSEEYVNSKTKLLWECSKGHRWWIEPINIRQGSWCPKCGGSEKLTIDDMHSLAQKKNGKCLSEEYVNSKTKLLWECSEGHQWLIEPINIRQGSWCPECAGNVKLSIDDMHSLAEKKNGKCLSEKYVNSKCKLLWECSEGHQWWAIYSNIQHKGRWCPKCAGNAKLTMNDMHSLAQKKNGKCLSEKYTNAHTKLLWECSEGHTWWAVPNSIQQGRWCPNCSRLRLL